MYVYTFVISIRNKYYKITVWYYNCDYSLIVPIPWNSTPPALWSGYKKNHATLCSYQRWFLHPATTSDRPLPWQRRISDLREQRQKCPPPKKNTVSLKATSPCLVLLNYVSRCICTWEECTLWFLAVFGEFVWTSFLSACIFLMYSITIVVTH